MSTGGDGNDDDRCAVCKKVIDFIVDSPIHHGGCGHYACAGTCSDGRNDRCRVCLAIGKVSDPGALPRLPVENELFVVPPNWQGGTEGGGSTGGGGGFFSSLFSRANRVSAAMRNRNETVKTSNDVHWLLSHGPGEAPVALLLQKRIGFNQCIRDGVVIDDFLRAGYTIGDLAQFPEVTPKLARDGITPLGVQALQALQVTAAHFIIAPDQLPMDKVREHTGLVNAHLVQKFKLAFHPERGIMSAGVARVSSAYTDWTIDQLRYMGFRTWQHFVRELGLRKLSHWYKLRASAADEQNLGVTKAEIALLENDLAPPSPQLAPTAMVIRPPLSPIIRQQQQVVSPPSLASPQIPYYGDMPVPPSSVQRKCMIINPDGTQQLIPVEDDDSRGKVVTDHGVVSGSVVYLDFDE